MVGYKIAKIYIRMHKVLCGNYAYIIRTRDILEFPISFDTSCLNTESIFRKLFKDFVVKIKVREFWDTVQTRGMLLYHVIYIALRKLCQEVIYLAYLILLRKTTIKSVVCFCLKYVLKVFRRKDFTKREKWVGGDNTSHAEPLNRIRRCTYCSLHKCCCS